MHLPFAPVAASFLFPRTLVRRPHAHSPYLRQSDLGNPSLWSHNLLCICGQRFVEANDHYEDVQEVLYLDVNKAQP